MYLPGEVVVYHLRRFKHVLYMPARYEHRNKKDAGRHSITIIECGKLRTMTQVRKEQICTLAEYFQQRNNKQ